MEILRPNVQVEPVFEGMMAYGAVAVPMINLEFMEVLEREFRKFQLEPGSLGNNLYTNFVLDSAKADEYRAIFDLAVALEDWIKSNFAAYEPIFWQRLIQRRPKILSSNFQFTNVTVNSYPEGGYMEGHFDEESARDVICSVSTGGVDVIQTYLNATEDPDTHLAIFNPSDAIDIYRQPGDVVFLRTIGLAGTKGRVCHGVKNITGPGFSLVFRNDPYFGHFRED